MLLGFGPGPLVGFLPGGDVRDGCQWCCSSGGFGGLEQGFAVRVAWAWGEAANGEEDGAVIGAEGED